MRKITPYWECFPSFFAYPFKMDALPALLCFSIGATLLISVMGVGIFSGLGLLMLTIGFFRFAFSVLERSAQGFLSESLAFQPAEGHKSRPYKHFAALLIAGCVIVAAIVFIGPRFALILGLLMMVVWPASLMQLTLSDSLAESISPVHLLALTTQIGLPYLGLWACVALLSASSSVATSWAPHVFGHGFVAKYVSVFISMYFIVVMYRLMGYVLYQYHEPLGLYVHLESEAERTPQQVITDDVAGLLKEGDMQGALARLRGATRDYPVDLAFHERYVKLLLAMEAETDLLRSAATSYLGLLVGSGRAGQALALLEKVQVRIPGFAPPDGTTALQLAQLAHEQHNTALAVSLIRGFDQRYPGHADAARAMLLAARILCERQRNDAQARKMLDALLTRYPQHPACEEARKLQQVIARLGDTAPQV
ncbi:hypothetical protein IGB42_03482 [Andreprevotia sp. IGB-42]|uniref:tetratricopeptide repeat protein n=1 Tax=Andreprevotia sp. IGB-42 TaxID=2497473 RepID=UPI001359D5C9|nr:tetratricopeptide repeat protein [Andreprevotia sp. IGB-42]KAF0811940.1 hypothetical protein IGB42_03482 [Andreprevotia sp. IGB-42]